MHEDRGRTEPVLRALRLRTDLPFTAEDGNHKAGYRRKLTFGEVNGGINWIGDVDGLAELDF